MTCARYRHFLSRYLDGEVTPRQRRELLEHVEGCRECAAWLARARQTDVLLKGGAPQIHPSDRVRDAILSSVSSTQKAESSRQKAAGTHSNSQSEIRNPKSKIRSWTLLASGLLLRFDPSPKRVALAAATSIFALIGIAYWLNLLPPLGGYKEFGFLVPGEESPASVNVTPLPAISLGEYGVGGPVAVPNMVRQAPLDSTRDVSRGAPVSIRFDQPMDRASVERSWVVDPPAAGTFTWSADNEVRFSAYEPGLLRGITYTVSLSSTARSITGTPLKQPIAWKFRTEEPYEVMPGDSIGGLLAPTSTLSLNFETSMNREQTSISLHAADPGRDLPVTLTWELDGRKVTVLPDLPLPEGTVYLRAGATSRTQAGDTLGQPHEFAYAVALPQARLRLLDGRINLVTSGSPTGNFEFSILNYELEDPQIQNSKFKIENSNLKGRLPDEDASDSPSVTFALYNLPAEYISALGAQERPWPLPLPKGLPGGLGIPVQTFGSASPTIQTSNLKPQTSLPNVLPAGTYLLVASRLSGAGTLKDWQMLVVSDYRLALAGTGNGAPFWATDAHGRAWQEGEVSLYSAAGALLEKGLTDERGLWTPDLPQPDARLAIARDRAGHLAAMLLDPEPVPNTAPTGSLSATLQTDRAQYYPGQVANFRVLLHPTSGATPLPDEEIAISLLTPAGNELSSLTLKPDDAGGVSGLFNLPGDLRPGMYTLLAQSGGLERRFPLHIEQPKSDTLSVFIVPGPPEDETTRVVTRTVSVLGAGGAYAAGAALTVTLGIMGDAWVSEPITTTTNADGKATVALELPIWIASYNDAGLYMNAVATLTDPQSTIHNPQSKIELSGSDSQYLDLTSVGAARAGMRQLVSPALNLAAIARPSTVGSISVRLVTLDSTDAWGNVLLSARSPLGERQAWSLDLSGADDLTVTLPRKYAGGQVTLWRAGISGSREMSLLPLSGNGMELKIASPSTASPSAPLTILVGLTDKEGQSLGGTASIWFRRVAHGDDGDRGDSRGEGRGWEPDIMLRPTGVVSATVQAPGTPGLWYMMSEASTGDGGYVRSWSALRVLPGPSIQTPPTMQTNAKEAQSLAVVVHNSGTEAMTAEIGLGGDGALQALGNDRQTLSIASGSSIRVDWRIQASQPGAHTALFTLTQGEESAGTWRLGVVAAESARTNTTFLSGVMSGERSIGVLVPSGLPQGGIELQVQASTSLLPTLSAIASSLASDSPSLDERAQAAAARLSATSAVRVAYAQAGAQLPSNVSLTGGEVARFLEQIYASQRDDGSWEAEDGSADANQSSITGTAHILLALRRYSLTSLEGSGKDEEQPIVDDAITKRGIAYLTSEVSRPLGDQPTTAFLDERAYGLYVLSSYGFGQAAVIRPLLLYASHKGEGLSHSGQAWLAIALMQSGSAHDGLLLVDRLLRGGVAVGNETAAPMLEALLVADRAWARALPISQERETSTYMVAAPTYVRLIMESRHGLGWGAYATTTDAVWALSSYATQAGEKPTKSLPSLTLNDRPVQVPSTGGDGANSVSIIIPGSEMHPGTNWLKLKAPNPGESVYYSLTLKATR